MASRSLLRNSPERSDEESHGVRDEILHCVQNDRLLQYAVDYYTKHDKIDLADKITSNPVSGKSSINR